jgi:hypothetical protein
MKIPNDIFFRFLDLKFEDYTLVKSTCSISGDYDFVIPAWAMYAIESGSYDNLSEEEISSLDEFLDDLVKTYGNANLTFSDEPYFDRSNDIDNLAGDVYLAGLHPSKVNTFIVDLDSNKLIMKQEFGKNYIFFNDIIYDIYKIFNLSDYNLVRTILDRWIEKRFNITQEDTGAYNFSKLNYRDDLIPCIMRKAIKTIDLTDIANQEKIPLNENSTYGEFNGPISIGLVKWRKDQLKPFTEFSTHPMNNDSKNKKLKNNIKRVLGMWEKNSKGEYHIPTHPVHSINEDLDVWFGKKKKPKGSKQPQGPWVNICKKDKSGKHPPCGRSQAKSTAYPKCRGYAAARSMSAEEKRRACSQKRRAEKKEPKVGKGNKPTMVSHKKKTNEEQIKRLVDLIVLGKGLKNLIQ